MIEILIKEKHKNCTQKNAFYYYFEFRVILFIILNLTENIFEIFAIGEKLLDKYFSMFVFN